MNEEDISKYCKSRKLQYLTDSEGSFVLGFESTIIVLEVLTFESYQVLSVTGRCKDDLGLELLPNAQEYAIYWNRARRWPKASIDSDGSLRLESDFPLGKEYSGPCVEFWLDVQLSSVVEASKEWALVRLFDVKADEMETLGASFQSNERS
ncbi:MAG: YbjN domain-containing protein [Nitrososphaerales archaeon]